MVTNEIYRFVNKIKRKFRTDDPFDIAQMCNITIVHRDFDNMKGMYTVQERCPFIFLDNELDEYMEKVVLFHELGHHFLHRHYAVSTFKEHSLYDMNSRFEIEANTFAANYIISDDEIERNMDYNYISEQLASCLCVPHELLLIKLKDMNSRGYNFKICFNPKAGFLGD